MPFAAFGTLRLLAIAVFIISVSAIDTTVVSGAFLELFLIGRIPGTDVIISFEAFFAGVIFFAWATITYNFTISALVRIHDLLTEGVLSTEEIEEITL